MYIRLSYGVLLKYRCLELSPDLLSLFSWYFGISLVYHVNYVLGFLYISRLFPLSKLFSSTFINQMLCSLSSLKLALLCFQPLSRCFYGGGGAIGFILSCILPEQPNFLVSCIILVMNSHQIIRFWKIISNELIRAFCSLCHLQIVSVLLWCFLKALRSAIGQKLYL